MKSFLDWTFYKPNLRNENTKRMFDCMLNQMTSGAKYWRSPNLVPPVPFKDEELRGVRTPALLLIGQQETYYDPVAAVERAKRLIPRIRAELIPGASHDLPVSKPDAVNPQIVAFLKNDEVIDTGGVGDAFAVQKTLVGSHG